MENLNKNALFYTFLAIFSSTAIIALLGITNIIDIDESTKSVFVNSLLVEVAAAVVLLYKSANFFTKTPEQYSKDIIGHWWELIHNEDGNIAASYTNISFSKTQQLIIIGGDAYNEKFEQTARWDSKPAVYNASNKRLFYYWEGFKFNTEDLGNKYSGIGFITFLSRENNNKFSNAMGWYSRGNIDEGNVELNNYMELIRATKTEIEIMHNGTYEEKKKTFTEMLINWRKKYGRKLKNQQGSKLKKK